MRLRKSRRAVVVPEWSNLGIGYQLAYGETFGQRLGADAPMPSEDVLRAAWAEYREKVIAILPKGETPWAARFDAE